MGTGVFFCKSTADGKQIIAKNHKDAANKFINELLMNCYKFKLKKVSEGTAKSEPDFSVSVNMVGEARTIYFQYSSLKPKNSI